MAVDRVKAVGSVSIQKFDGTGKLEEDYKSAPDKKPLRSRSIWDKFKEVKKNVQRWS